MESSKTGFSPFKCAICGSYKSSFTLHQQHKSGHKKKYIANKNGRKSSKFRNKYKQIKQKRSKTSVTEEETFGKSVAANTPHTINFTPKGVQTLHNNGDFSPKGVQKTHVAADFTPYRVHNLHDAADLTQNGPQKTHSVANCFLNSVQKKPDVADVTPKRNITYKCDKCHQCFSDLNNLMWHLQLSHNSTKAEVRIEMKKTSLSEQKKSRTREKIADFTSNNVQETMYKCDKHHLCFSNLNNLMMHFEKYHMLRKKTCLSKQKKVNTYDGEDYTSKGVQKTHNLVDLTSNDLQKAPNVTDSTPDYEPKTHDAVDFAPKGLLKKYTCEKCPQYFNELIDLNTHIQKSHSNIQDKFQSPFSCAHCDKHFLTKYSLEYHEKTHESKRYECNICHERFTYIGLYKEHVRGHNQGCDPRGITFQCQYCPSHFTTVKEYAAHTKTHSQPPKEKPFECTHCDKSFFCTEDMERHVLTHTREKLKRVAPKFKCEICGQVLGNNNRVAHMRIHNKEKLFLCEWCGLLFSRHNNLKQHLMIHTDEKPHECRYCHARFRQTGPMRQHMKVYCKQKPSDGKNSVNC